MNGKTIPGFENYLIYANGNLYSKLRGRFLKKKINKYGYVIYHTKTGVKQFPTAHYLVATAFLSNPNGYTQINHIDGNKENNNVENLEWCTASENAWHRVHILKKKPIRYGDKQVKAKNLITNEELLFTSESQAAKYFNISQTTISKKILTNHITYSGKTKGWLFSFI